MVISDALLGKIMATEIEHNPVLLQEVIGLLNCSSGSIVVDATVGLGGHAEKILEIVSPSGKLIGIDRDAESLALARDRLNKFGAQVELYHDNYKNLPLILNRLGHEHVDAILVDLGVSSYQLLTPDRGFTFQVDAPLDMRMNRSQKTTAADLVNHLSEEELARLIYEYGEERRAKRIARAIVKFREKEAITKTKQFSNLIARIVSSTSGRIHPATRTFQAFRIAVNAELTDLDEFIVESVKFLKSGGRLVVISFHSLEDRIVKRAFKELSGHCVCFLPPALCKCLKEALITPLTRKPVRASQKEVMANPRARSAILRACERI